MSSNGTKINTFVFFDTETTGLPEYEFNRTRITELTMIAAGRDHLMECDKTVLPRVLHKLTLCINPRKLITSTEITGLANDMLEHQRVFDIDTVNLIQLFLSRLPGPICLVAHNGNKFDYPLLQKELKKLGQKLSEDILCADSLIAFKELHDSNLMPDNLQSPLFNDKLDKEIVDDESISADVLDCSKILDNKFNEFKNELNDYVPEDVKHRNETTPKRATSSSYAENNIRAKKERRNGYHMNNSTNAKKCLFVPRTSFKLVDIYKRIFNEDAKDAHNAEGDVLTLIHIAIACKENFFLWCDDNSIPFHLVKSL